MKKLFITLALFIYAAIGLNAQFYLGASIGNSFVNKNLSDVNGDDFTVDENAFGYKFFAGYGINFLGVEAGYRDLGEATNETEITRVKTRVTGWDFAARGKVNVGPIIAFAKAGAFFAKYENEINTYSYSENSTNFLWGLGAGFQIKRLGFRLEYEAMGKEDNGLSMLTAGATYFFGKTETEHD